MSDEASRIPDLLFEQLALGELDEADERWLRARLADAAVELRLHMLREADAALAHRLHQGTQLAQIHEKLRIAKAAAKPT